MSRRAAVMARPQAAVPEFGASPPDNSPPWLAQPTPLPVIPDQVLQFVEDSLHRYLPGSPPGFLRQAILQYQQGGHNEPTRPDPTPRLMTAAEVRKALSVSAMTLNRLMRSSAIAVVRISGRRIGFDPDDIRAFIASRKTGAKRGGRRAST